VLGGPSRGEHLFSFSEKVKFQDFSEIFELKNDGSVKSDKISEEFRNEVGLKSIYQKSYEKENAFLELFHVLLEHNSNNRCWDIQHNDTKHCLAPFPFK
jgi:hypothetical protein